MNCPHCHGKIVLGWQTLRARRRSKGLCVDCRQPAEVNPDHGKAYWRCQQCRDIAKIRRALYTMSE